MRFKQLSTASLAALAMLTGVAALCAGCADDATPRGSAAAGPASGAQGAGYPMELDLGLTWFGPGDVGHKAIPGRPDAFYDPSRPTILYVHGWQKDQVKERFRESFNYGRKDPKHGPDLPLADFWIHKGWNVGMFYWDQLADEADVADAEAKIWTAAGPRGMRWLRGDQVYVTDGSPTKSAAELFVDAIVSAMKDQTNGTIRLAGHSLGNQMVTRAAKILSDRIDAGQAPSVLMPKRIALLDPFWSNGAKDYLDGRWTGEASRDDVDALLKKGVVFERYTTSDITRLFVGDANDALTKRIGDTRFSLDYISRLDQKARHVAAPFLYFHSFAFAPPLGCWAGSDGARSCTPTAPSAATPDSVMQEMMGAPFNWVQTGGTQTESPDDDIFDREAR